MQDYISQKIPDLNASEAKELLRNWRENNVRKSEEVIHHWQNVLSNNLHKLGNEKHAILEQVCIAALDTNRLAIAGYCIKLLGNDFPGSQRVRRLKAMRLEAQERYDEALQVLDALISEDKSNAAPKKRKIAILKAQGRNVEAIKELTEYLKTFMADAEAWQELSELYLTEHDLPKAAFCVEELILHNPHNHLLHQRYADIKYTIGGLENIELARNYYCQALKLNPKNLRALYGLYLASTNIALSQKTSAQRKKEALRLAEWTMERIRALYDAKRVSNNIEERLGALSITA